MADETALELERLRGAMSTGFAEMRGHLTAIEASVGHVTDRLDQHSDRLTALDKRVSALERARWPLPSIAALVGVLGLVLAVRDRFR